jgi:hypothetical protein
MQTCSESNSVYTQKKVMAEFTMPPNIKPTRGMKIVSLNFRRLNIFMEIKRHHNSEVDGILRTRRGRGYKLVAGMSYCIMRLTTLMLNAKYLFFISRPYFPSPGLEEVKVDAAGKTDGFDKSRMIIIIN